MFLILITLYGCGEVTTIDNGTIIYPTETPIPTYTPEPISIPTSTPTPSTYYENSDSDGIKIIGKVTYDRVHVKSSGVGLNYNNITRESARGVTVKLVKNSCTSNNILRTTSTNDSGDYQFLNLTPTQNVRICVYAKLKKRGVGGYDVEVVDNTNHEAIYTMQSSLFNIGEDSTRRNLNAKSGWSGYGYSGARTSAPFAILDSIYTI